MIASSCLTVRSTEAMSQLERWVGDQLHDILGISDRYITQYLIGLAGKASNTDDYVEKLRETGTIEVDQSIVSFAKELWTKVKAQRC